MPEIHENNRTFNLYLEEFVYGAMDGSVTTFAVVSGASGAGLSSSIVIILGFANLFADGLSMSIGSYLSRKSEMERYQKFRRQEYWEIEHIPETERQEIREIYIAKGFHEPLLTDVVDKIVENKDRWVDVMMKEELGMIPAMKKPANSGAATFISFVAVGFIPLLIYVWDYAVSPLGVSLFLVSSWMTLSVFLVIGYLKSLVTGSSRFRSMLETVLLGVVAAGVAYFIGNWLETVIR